MRASKDRGGVGAGIAWRAIAYFGFVALSVPLLRGGERATHGSFLAAVTTAGLRLFGVPAARVDDVVSGAGFSMQIAPVCDGADLAVILGLAILLSPAPGRARVWGIAAALGATQLMNVGRLMCMFVVGAYLPAYFDLFHQVLWQAVAIMACVALYVAWLNRATQPLDGA